MALAGEAALEGDVPVPAAAAAATAGCGATAPLVSALPVPAAQLIPAAAVPNYAQWGTRLLPGVTRERLTPYPAGAGVGCSKNQALAQSRSVHPYTSHFLNLLPLTSRDIIPAHPCGAMHACRIG